MSADSTLLGPVEIKKNSREALHISVDRFRGRPLLSMRIWFEPREGGDRRPGREGFAIALERLPEIAAALRQLEADAIAVGLLAPAESGTPR